MCVNRNITLYMYSTYHALMHQSWMHLLTCKAFHSEVALFGVEGLESWSTEVGEERGDTAPFAPSAALACFCVLLPALPVDEVPV